MNIVVRRFISTIITGSLLLTQSSVNAKVERRVMVGGALGIIQCFYTPGGKTKVTWQVIVNDKNKPINGAKFDLSMDGRVLSIFEGVIPPTTNYTTVETFDGSKRQAVITGDAFSISLSGVHRYSLKTPLPVDCTRL